MILKGISVNQDPPTKDYLWITPKGNTRFWNQSTWMSIGGSGGSLPVIESSGKYLVTTGTQGNFSLAWSDIDLSNYISGTIGYAAIFNSSNSITNAVDRIRVGDGIIEWDSTNGGFKIYNANSTFGNPVAAGIYAGWVSALGANSSGGGGGGGGDLDWSALIYWDEEPEHIINKNYLPYNLEYVTSHPYYAVEEDSNGKLYVNVNWHDTTYNAGTGLTLSGFTLNHSNSISQGNFGLSSNTTANSITLPYVSYDGQGHISAVSSNTFTIGNLDAATVFSFNTKIPFNNLPNLYVGYTKISGSTNGNTQLKGISKITHATTNNDTSTAAIEWDQTNNAWHFYGGIYSDSFVSALGLNGSGGGGSGDINYADLWQELASSSSEHYAGSTIINSTHLPLGYTQNNKNYPVQADNNKLYVNVPWTDNDTTYKLTLNGTQYGNGSVSLGSFFAPIQVGSNGYILKSNGSGAPSWIAQSNLSVGSASTWTTARTLTIGATGKSVNGSANVTWNTTEINRITLGSSVGRVVIALCKLSDSGVDLNLGWAGNIYASRGGQDDFTQWANINIAAIKGLAYGFKYTLITSARNNYTEIAQSSGFRACRFQYTVNGVKEWYGGVEFYNSWGIRKFDIDGIYTRSSFTPFIVQYATMSNSVATSTNDEIYNSIDFSNTSCVENSVAYKGTINGYTLLSDVNSGTANRLTYYNSSSQVDDTSIVSNGKYIKIGSTSNDFLQIGDAKISWDSDNGGLKIEHVINGQTAGLYADWISALGANSGGGSGGGGINWADFWNELNLSETHTYSGTKIIDRDYLPINGTSSDNGTFYAPVSSGTSGMFLKSSGTNNAPVWSSLSSSDIPNLSASKINSGTFDTARIPTLSITDKTNGTLPITRGGTGATSAKGAEYNILSEASTALETDFNNTTRFAIERTNPSATNGVLVGYRTASQLWSYIKGKMSSDGAVNVSGNAATATILQTIRTINGTNFNGSANITTSTWGTSRNISISDADGTNTGDAVSVNGSENKTLKLPSTIKASLNGTVNGYSIASTINSGTANRLAYYTSSGIDDASTTYVSNTKLAINSTSEPSYNLYVNGTSYFNNNVGIGDILQNTQSLILKSSQAQLRLISFSNGENYIESGNTSWSASANLHILGYNDGSIDMLTLKASTAYISGNVGIGTNSPPVKLSVAGDIYASGGVTALQTVTSDKRLKKNIKKFNAKDIVDKLNPVSFEWNSRAKKLSDFKDGTNYGLIAQDSDGIIDNLVFDLPDGNGYKGVRYEKLIPILLQAVKEQQKEIDELKQIIKKLKV